MNGTILSSAVDMGKDGGTGTNKYVAKDVYAFHLNYFTGEYKSINSTANPFSGTHAYLNTDYRALFNGNISSMAVNIGALNQPYLYNYKYDQLNRLTKMDAFTAPNDWSGLTATNKYQERIWYDGNGNILGYKRYFDNATNEMDSMSYKYYAGTNKLSHIKDNAQDWVNGSQDIEDQDANNYTYDEIGNLVADASENISSIKWNVYGKITEINRSSAVSFLNNTKRIQYWYDAAGNRIGKKVVKFEDPKQYYTWYVRDASGNTMAVYESEKDTTSSTDLSGFDLYMKEAHIYGSSRIGVMDRYEAVEDFYYQPWIIEYEFQRGYKKYEMSNHLGNVLTTITDRKYGYDTTSDDVADYYIADVASAQDYYPFGMISRQVEGDAYRYGFNGKENDDNVKGQGNQQDYGMRIYDPRLGRFLSVDPISNNYPMLTPYQFASNRPIDGIDQDGLEFMKFNDSYVRMQVGYDPKLKKSTARIHYRLAEFKQDTWFKERILTHELENRIRNTPTGCSNCITSRYNTLVAELDWAPAAPEAAMQDAPRLPKALEEDHRISPGAETAGPKLPRFVKNYKRNAGLLSPSSGEDRSGYALANTRIEKAGALIDAAGVAGQMIGEAQLSYMATQAQGHQVMLADKVLSIIGNGITSGKVKALYRNETSLTNLANYLLYGENIKDEQLKKVAQELWSEYIKNQIDLKIKKSVDAQQKEKIDNTNVNM